MNNGKQSTVTASFQSEEDLERRLFRYTARYGQHPETETIYHDAILACQSIDNLELTVADIARKYNLKPECLRNQLKRHFPEIYARREQMRDMLGLSRPGNRGLKKATVEKYADAIQMLRNTSLTVKEVANRCNVSYSGLQQHLLCYHKDIAESRLLYRADALLQTVPSDTLIGSPSAIGGVRKPRPDTVEMFAPAVKFYQETNLSVPQIAARCGLNRHALESYLKRWYPEDVARRRLAREAAWAAKKEERAGRPDRSCATVARLRFTPAIALLQEGKTLSQAAKILNVQIWDLSAWFRRNHPEILEQTRTGMFVLPSGQKTLRRTYDRFLPIAEYIASHPSKSTKELSAKFNVPASSLVKYISTYFPEQWSRHCKACAEKAKRLRKCHKAT